MTPSEAPATPGGPSHTATLGQSSLGQSSMGRSGPDADAFGRNSVGISALAWSSGWDEDAARRAAVAAQAAGYDRLEVPLLAPWRVGTATARAILAGHGLAVTGCLGLTDATDVSCGDAEIVRAGEQRLRQAVDAVAAIGGDLLCGIIYSKLGAYEQPPVERGWADCADVLRRIADHAAAYGVRLGLEVGNRYETNLLNTAAQALELLAEIDHPNVRVHLDTYHMNIEETDVASPVLACGDRLGYVQLSDSHRGCPGTGTVDFDAFFAALATIGYRGPITVEAHACAGGAQPLARAFHTWREPDGDPDATARQARRYVADQLGRHSAAAPSGREGTVH